MFRRALLFIPLSLLLVAPAAGTAAKKPKERQVDARASSAVLPRVSPYGKLRASERSVFLRARTVRDGKIEADLQIFCIDSQLRVKRTFRTLRGTGVVTGTVKRPRRGGSRCSTAASVRVTSRPAPANARLGPVRVGAALYARR